VVGEHVRRFHQVVVDAHQDQLACLHVRPSLSVRRCPHSSPP
jgi:hypothetical protein